MIFAINHFSINKFIIFFFIYFLMVFFKLILNYQMKVEIFNESNINFKQLVKNIYMIKLNHKWFFKRSLRQEII